MSYCRSFRSGLVVALVCGFAAWLVQPASAAAEIDDDLRETLEEQIEPFEEGDNAEAKQAALMTRALLDGAEARESLEEHAEDGDDARVRLGAAMGLWLTGDAGALDTLGDELVDDRRLYVTLRQVTFVLPEDKKVELLRRIVRDAEDRRREDALRYLAQQDGALYGSLEDYLTDSDDALRKSAVKAALFTKRDRAGEFASSMVEPTQPEAVRAEGVDLAIALTSRSGGHDAAEEALAKAVDDASSEIAVKAARHLLEHGDKSGADRLEERLANLEEDEDKRELARFLVEHGATVSKSTAESLKASEDTELTQLGWQFLASTNGDEVFDELEEKFGSTNYDDRLIAVKALGHIDEAGAIKLLEKGLFEGRVEFRMESIEGLRRLAHPRSLPALKKALNDERDKEVLLKVIDTISRIDDDQALNLLRFKTTTNDREIKLAIIKAIRRLGDPDGVRPLRVLGQDRNLEIRWEAFLTTLELDRERGLSQLESQLRNPPEGFMSDIEELDASVRDEIIAHVLRHGDSDARGAALATARTIVESQLDTYRDLVRDSQAPENVRREALLGLIEQNDEDDLTIFEEVAQDLSVEEVARLAAWTLAARGGEEQEESFEVLAERDDEPLNAIAAWGMANVRAGKARQAQQ